MNHDESEKTPPAPQQEEPCPDRFLDNIGFMFAAGTVCGSVFHFIKGHENSPAGHRLSGAVQAVRMNVPRSAGRSAAWGALYSVFDCSMVYIREKEDPWNPIIANGATAGFLSIRHGPIAAAGSALFIAAISSVLEGALILVYRSELGRSKEPETPRVRLPQVSVPRGGGSSSLFRGIFGSRRVDPKVKEGFDSPVPTFEYKSNQG